MYSVIVNPKTGKLVDIFSKKGKIILKKYLNQLGGSGNGSNHVKPSWKCGIFAIPTDDIKNYSVTESFMQKPYPWVKLHITVASFMEIKSFHIKI